MKIYRVNSPKLSGSNFHEVKLKALVVYGVIKRKSKRRPYIRSAYFSKQKIFLPLFWQHLHEKRNLREKTRRLKLFPCGIILIQNSTFEPTTKQNPNKHSEVLHRFAGVTPDDEIFFVQIKEDKKKGEKWLISIFPIDA